MSTDTSEGREHCKGDGNAVCGVSLKWDWLDGLQWSLSTGQSDLGGIFLEAGVERWKMGQKAKETVKGMGATGQCPWDQGE